MEESRKIIFVIGPTASGKSAWALQQAIRTGGSIVNIDSVQFYAGLKIGSAAPSDSDLQQAPHYLYGYVKPPVEMTAGYFLRDFYQLLQTKQKLSWPLYVAGGTGFYVQALEKGMYDLPPADENLQKKLEAELALKGSEVLHQELLQADPETQIHPNDHFRLVRALEIWRCYKIPPSRFKDQMQNKNKLQIPHIKIGFQQDKEEALNRITARTHWMIDNGLIDETKFFLEQGYENWAPLKSVGYAQTVQYLKQLEFKTISELEKGINTATWQLVKKQKTWFKRDESILWSNGSAESNSQVERKLDQFLKTN